MIHQGRREAIGFNLISTGLLASPFRARISSRITTVIRVANEPSNKP